MEPVVKPVVFLSVFFERKIGDPSKPVEEQFPTHTSKEIDFLPEGVMGIVKVVTYSSVFHKLPGSNYGVFAGFNFYLPPGSEVNDYLDQMYQMIKGGLLSLDANSAFKEARKIDHVAFKKASNKVALFSSAAKAATKAAKEADSNTEDPPSCETLKLRAARKESEEARDACKRIVTECLQKRDFAYAAFTSCSASFETLVLMPSDEKEDTLKKMTDLLDEGRKLVKKYQQLVESFNKAPDAPSAASAAAPPTMELDM
jgi:hypothetical protein